MRSMLGERDVAATLAVSDMAAAKEFYEGKLGFTKIESPIPEEAGILYRSGNSVVLVYPSAYAGTNKATAATWGVGEDFDAVVDDLRSKGVAFEHYDDLPETTRDGDVHSMGGLRSVWFKDPDGNILNVGNQSV
jgi:catechol 2,3-dioxygenase-like lactoylglutathione lyase family enzyme